MTWACDWDGPTIYDEQEVVARKEHSCVECSAPILKGERHLTYRGMWDHSWSGGRQHLLCRDCCVWIRDVLNGECISFGELHEWWSQARSWTETVDWPRSDERKAKANYRIGARMYAMICRRERLAGRSA